MQLSSISRRHAQLVFDENGAVLLENLSATNPAILNGKPVPVEQGRVKVRNKDVLELGPRQFRIDLGNVPVSSTKKRKAFVPGDDDSTEELTNDVTAALRSTMLRTAPAPTSARKTSDRRSLPTPVRAAITRRRRPSPKTTPRPRRGGPRRGADGRAPDAARARGARRRRRQPDRSDRGRGEEEAAPPVDPPGRARPAARGAGPRGMPTLLRREIASRRQSGVSADAPVASRSRRRPRPRPRAWTSTTRRRATPPPRPGSAASRPPPQRCGARLAAPPAAKVDAPEAETRGDADAARKAIASRRRSGAAPAVRGAAGVQGRRAAGGGDAHGDPDASAPAIASRRRSFSAAAPAPQQPEPAPAATSAKKSVAFMRSPARCRAAPSLTARVNPTPVAEGARAPRRAARR